MTQTSLAKGICTQAVISKIENSESIPSTDNFIAICKKLEIPTFEILKVLEFDVSSQEEYFFSEELQAIYYKEDYEAINQIINKLIKVDELNEEERVYYDWLNSTLNFYYNGNEIEALSSVENILESYTKSDIRLYDRIIQSLAVMYHHVGKNKESLELFQKIEHEIIFSDSLKFKIYSLYYLAKIYQELKEYSKSLSYNSQAIDYLLAEESMFCLGKLFLQESQILHLQSFNQEALVSCNKAIAIFDIENKNYLKTQALTQKNYINNM